MARMWKIVEAKRNREARWRTQRLSRTTRCTFTAECKLRTPKEAGSLTPGQRGALLRKEGLRSERFVDRAPANAYATLLDEGTYLCSIRTMYRLLEECDEVRERRNQLRHPRYQRPELLATGPNQVWSWDITKLPGPNGLASISTSSWIPTAVTSSDG
jgi:transposase InsO family protein